MVSTIKSHEKPPFKEQKHQVLAEDALLREELERIEATAAAEASRSARHGPQGPGESWGVRGGSLW